MRSGPLRAAHSRCASEPCDPRRDREADRPGDRHRPVRLADRDHPHGDVVLARRQCLAGQRRRIGGGADHRHLGNAGGRGAGPWHRRRRGGSLPSARGTPASFSRSPGSSVPVLPSAAAATKTHGLAASIRLASIARDRVSSRRCPVGSSRPVLAPPGSRNSSLIGAAVPATPSIAKSPSAASAPPLDREAREDDLAGVGVVDAHRRFAIGRAGDQPSSIGERADRGGHVAAVAAVIDFGGIGR